MRYLEILTEEPSAETMLKILLPKIIAGRACTYKIIVHQGKSDLLKKLPLKLRAYKKSLSSNSKIVVLIDRDNEDCIALKSKLELMAKEAGLLSKSQSNLPDFQILNRIAVEEIESWFLGDEVAVRKAYPRVKPFAQKSTFKHPDSIKGSTSKLIASCRLLS